MLTLRNISGRMLICSLVHAAFCEDDPKRQKAEHKPYLNKAIHTIVVDHDERSGALAMRKIPKRVARAITFKAGQTVDKLPNAVRECPDVARAIARRQLLVVACTTEPIPAPAPPAPPVPAPAPVPGDRK